MKVSTSLTLNRPYFKKSERLTESTPAHQAKHGSYFNPENHGTEGPIHSVYSKEYGASHQHWHSTLQNLGVETNKNHFGGSNVGVWTSLTSVEPQGRSRCYSATGYYRPISSRSNLIILTEATVEEISIEKTIEDWVATGARFSHDGVEHRVKASQEVILSAGSVQSPQLLELSGVGNPAILERAGIEVKVPNRNVGENLQEHMSESNQNIVPRGIPKEGRFCLIFDHSDGGSLRDIARDRDT